MTDPTSTTFQTGTREQLITLLREETGWDWPDEQYEPEPTFGCDTRVPSATREVESLADAILDLIRPQTLSGTVQRSEWQQAAYERAKARYFTASEQPPVVELRDRIIALAVSIDGLVPPGRHKSIAFTLLEDLQMRANRGLFAPTEENPR